MRGKKGSKLTEDEVYSKPKLALLVAVALSLALIARAAVVQGTGLLRKGSARPSERALVQEALAGFIYGVQHNMPGIVSDYYSPPKAASAGAEQQMLGDLGNAAIRSMRRSGDDPIVVAVRPRVSFQGGGASVDCCLVWHFTNANDETVRIVSKERFSMVKSGDRYRISGSTVVPIILAHWNNRKALENELSRIKDAEVRRD